MKKSLIFLSVLVVAMIAFFDAKDRFAELDSVAANTPSQVEMKQMINKMENRQKIVFLISKIHNNKIVKVFRIK